MLFIEKILFLVKTRMYINFDKFFNSNNIYSCVTNKNGYFHKINDTWLNLGYTKDELINNPFITFVVNEDVKRTMEEFGKLTKFPNYITSDFVNKYRKKNGEFITLLWCATRFMNKVYAIAIDISSRDTEKNLLEELELLKLQSKDLKVGIWDWNVTTGSLYWSDYVYEIFDTKECSYENYMAKIPASERNKIVKAIDDSIKDKTGYTIEHSLISGKRLYGSGRVKEKNNEIHLIGMVHDITSAKLYEEELIKDKEKAQSDTKKMTEFVSHISHEIRTPLNGIIGMCLILRDTELSEEQTEYLNVISDSSGLLLSIVNNVLDLSKMDAGFFELQNTSINIRELFNEIKQNFENELHKKNLVYNIKIDLEVPEIIVCDRNKLKQVINNLLSNSIKFTEIGSINIFVKITSEDLSIKIVDTGPGISEESLKHIFSPFNQGDNNYLVKSHSGTGLGLSICKKIIDKMGGTIEIKSDFNWGTSAIVTIPVCNLENKYTKTTNDTIVLIEDNDFNEKLLTKFLNKKGYTDTISFKNGEIAKKYICEHKIPHKLIFMDLHMPIVNGFECTKYLRENGIDTPIIVTTANSMLNPEEICEKYNFQDFLIKPLNINELDNIINKYLKT